MTGWLMGNLFSIYDGGGNNLKHMINFGSNLFLGYLNSELKCQKFDLTISGERKC